MTKFLTIGFFAFVFALVFAVQVGAIAPRPQRGDVTSATPDTYNSSWVTGTSQDGGATGGSIKLGDNSTDGSDFAYYSFRNWWDQNLSDVTKVRASFKPDAGTVNLGGSPRFSLLLDADGDGSYVDPGSDPSSSDVNVFLDPAHCGDAVKDGWRDANFTGDKTDCAIHDSTGAVYVSDSAGTAWNKLVAAYPDAKVWFMFLIQDATAGSNFVDRIMLDSAFFTKAP